jgi:exosortase D (VPLPA-CTERM-specific)
MASVSGVEKRPSVLEELGEHRFGGLWLLLAALASLPLFWFGFVSLGNAWLTPEYSHGPLIPVLSAYMFLRELRGVPPTDRPIRDRWPGVVILFLALGVAILGNIARIPDIVTYGFIIWVAGIILTCFGFSRGLLFWTGVLHLVYMLPLPNSIQWQFTNILQFWSSELGVWFLRQLGVTVFLDGNIIDLGIHKLNVAEACSGLRYLFPILSFSYVFCVLYNGPVWHKIVLLVSAAPITIFMNAFRIAMIGVLVNNFGIGMADGFYHAFEGWVIFGTCVAILFGLAVLMQRLQRNPKPLSETIDLEFTGLGDQARRFFAVVPSKALIVAAIGTLLVSLAWIFAPAPEQKRPDREPFAVFPQVLSNWTGSPGFLQPEIEAVLAADDYFASTFQAAGERAPVDFFVAYYHKQTEGAGIHSPEVCIPSAGWEMGEITPTEVALDPSTGWAPFKLNRAIIERETGTNRQLVYYWFEQSGEQLTNDFHAKMVSIWQALTIGRTDGALVRFMTPIAPNETEADADARLQRFMTEAMPVLPRFVPGETPVDRDSR